MPQLVFILKTGHDRRRAEATQLFLIIWKVRKEIYNLSMIIIVLTNTGVPNFPSLFSNEMCQVGIFLHRKYKI